MCLGGSATNDGGCGAAAACGVRFLDSAGKAFVPVGGHSAPSPMWMSPPWMRR